MRLIIITMIMALWKSWSGQLLGDIIVVISDYAYETDEAFAVISVFRRRHHHNCLRRQGW